MLETTYQPADIEARIHKAWEAAEAFKCGKTNHRDPAAKGAKAETYCIVIPPPNVTGSLHMGHALNNTLQDILCRFERMRGKDVLWQPGTDHAGIATQMVVERQLAERQQPDRRAMGRDKFLETVWAWKAESGGTIIGQLKRLGASCDWSRERFTMDPGLSKAVLKVFVELYNTKLPDGTRLIYKDKRLVNWDPKFQSAISDLEVEQVEKKGSFKWARGEKDKQGNPVALNHGALGKLLDRDPSGHMYYFNYPLEGATYNPDDPSTFITVATTRPETMLGDTAVAVHPSHEKSKYKGLIGKRVMLPLANRPILIVGDEYADPEKGTGAVKITPAHDFNDFEVGKRHADKLAAPINIFDAFGCIVQRREASLANIPMELRGLDRFKARTKVVEMLDALGMVVKIEPTTHTVPHGDRSGVPVEPWLTDQWYVNAAELAKPALAAVRDGTTKFVPERFANDYYRWLENIQPWCISRQLWWGHQIPAWYGPKKVEGEEGWYSIFENPEIFVANSEAEAIELARKKYGCEIRVLKSPPTEDLYPEQQQIIDDQLAGKPRWEVIWRDPDVLDTWFSSALWPFSTLGWPDKTPEVAKYYPTSALVTGFDIIFFWVARMMMMGCHFMKDDKGQPLVPFHDVYIHGLVRDEKGQKMSKSKGNVIDPIDLMDGIGLDALIAKRTSGLMKPDDAKKIAQETRKDYPNGFEAFGADALRFTMAAMAAQGSDVKFSVERIKGYRNFATKVWNASRFAEQNECVRQRDFDPRSVKQTVNKWIAGETERAAKAVTAGIEAYKFNEAATAVYEFVWGTFCDWYLELIKPVLGGDDEPAKAETRATTAWVLDQILKLLHPFMPFITEELWAHMVEYGEKRRSLLAVAPWPELDGLSDPAADDEIGWVIRIVSEIRSLRTEMSIPWTQQLPLVLTGSEKGLKARTDRHADTITRLARLGGITIAKAVPKSAAVFVVGETTAALPLEGVIDMAAEKARLEKEIASAQSDLAKMDAKLANPAFVEKAKPEAVEETRARKAELEAGIAKWSAALARLEV